MLAKQAHSGQLARRSMECATLAFMERRSLVAYLELFMRHGNEIAYVQPHGYRTQRVSYRGVVEAAYQFARELEARGIVKGDRVLLWGPNSAQWVQVFLGCMLRGAIVVPIDEISAEDFALRVYQNVGGKFLVCASAHSRPEIPCLPLENLATALGQHSCLPYPVDIAPDDPLEIVFTSGTTADPKGVVITHGNVLANIAPLESEIRRYLKYERFFHPIRFLNLLPLSHVFGQFLGIFLPPLMGGTVIFQHTLKPADVMETVRRNRVSVVVTVPRVLQSLKEKIERDLEGEVRSQKFHRKYEAAKGKHFLHRWWIFRDIRRRFGWKFWAFISGGAALDTATEQFWDRLGYAVIQGYGLTETTSLISVNHPFRLGKGSIGKVLAGREVKLAEDGEILVRGGGVATGYWNSHELRPMADEAGWYRTGDLGALDAAGNLYFKGRKKDVIVTPSGMNVYPQDLEGALRQQPEVRDAVVVPLPRNGNAEPCAVLVLRSANINVEALIQRANQSLAEYQRMHAWWVWPESDFPRTSTLKPRRNLIRATVLAQFSQKNEQSSSGLLEQLIGRITGRAPDRLLAAANLESDLNLNSLDRVELLSALEDRYQVDLAESRFAEVRTVGDLERMLQGSAPARARYHYPRWVLRWPVTWVRLFVHYLLLRPAVFLLGWPKVYGRENLRGVRGPVIVVCNHLGDVDPGFILTALPAYLRHKLAIATGGEALEILLTLPRTRGLHARIYDRIRWALGVSLLNLFPLPRESGFRESFAYAGECVDRGYSVLIFPEGHHSVDGKLRPFRAGIGLLVKNLELPVVPMRIDGLFEVKQAGKKFAPPGQIQVRIGSPISFPASVPAAEIARQLQERVKAL
jgi:long-chain acyl-CoA synthetase